MSCSAKVTFFGADGKLAGNSVDMSLPKFLNWMPIELKLFWFLNRGYGPPAAVNLIMYSQGEQMLATVITPLRDFKYKELQEIDNGLESKVDQYARENGFSRTPRNQ